LAIIYQNTKIIEPSIVDNNDGLFFSLLKSGLGSHFVIINVIHLKKKHAALIFITVATVK